MNKYFNLKGSSVVGGKSVWELTATNEECVNIKSIIITSAATASATLSFFIQNDPSSGTTNTYYITFDLAIPANTTLLLDEPSMFRFDISYGLYVKVGSSNNVDLIINT